MILTKKFKDEILFVETKPACFSFTGANWKCDKIIIYFINQSIKPHTLKFNWVKTRNKTNILYKRIDYYKTLKQLEEFTKYETYDR
jgi:hypothetical protein